MSCFRYKPKATNQVIFIAVISKRVKDITGGKKKKKKKKKTTFKVSLHIFIHENIRHTKGRYLQVGGPSEKY